MPCAGPTDQELREAEMLRNEKRYGERLSDLDVATRVACELMQALALEVDDRLSVMAKKWIRDHEKLDKQREAEEHEEFMLKQKRMEALQKLNDYDIEALGIQVGPGGCRCQHCEPTGDAHTRCAHCCPYRD